MPRINSSYNAMTCVDYGVQSAYPFPLLGGANSPLTNMPAAVTEQLFGLSQPIRKRINFLYFPWIGLEAQVNVAGTATSRITAQWSTDNATWNFFISGTAGVDAVSLAATGVHSCGFGTPENVRLAGLVYVRWVTIGGDGVADPAIQNTVMRFGTVGVNTYDASNSEIKMPYPVFFVSKGTTTLRFNIMSPNWRTFTAIQWLNQPLALTEYLGNTSNRSNFGVLFRNSQIMGWTFFNLVISVVGAAGATYARQYSVDNGVSWSFFDGVSGPSLTVDALGVRQSTTVAVQSAIRDMPLSGTLLFRLVGSGGNGVADPSVVNTGQDYQAFYAIDPSGAV